MGSKTPKKLEPLIIIEENPETNETFEEAWKKAGWSDDE
jgi:hypothetical protein